MRLLIITQTVDTRDSNLGFFHAWINEFAKRAAKVDVICNSKGEYRFPQNVEVRSLGKERGLGRLRRYINFYRYLLRALLHADAVFVHMIPAWVIMVYPLAFIFRKKIFLWYTHGFIPMSLRIAEKLVKKIFTASKESCRLKSAKIVAVGHGIDVERFAAAPQEFTKDLRLLSVSRISPSKDIKTLILAVSELTKRGIKNIKFDITGAPILPKDKIYFEELGQLVEELDLSSMVNFLGAIGYEDMPKIYKEHNIFLHASMTGSVDKAVLEALASGLQIFTSSVAYGDFASAIVNFSAGDYKDLASKLADKFASSGVMFNARGAALVREKAGIGELVGKIIKIMGV